MNQHSVAYKHIYTPRTTHLDFIKETHDHIQNCALIVHIYDKKISSVSYMLHRLNEVNTYIFKYV